MVTYTSLNLRLFGIVNKKNQIPKIMLYITYFDLLDKLPKYEENSDFFKLSGAFEKTLVSNFVRYLKIINVSMDAMMDRRTVRWISPVFCILNEKFVHKLLRKLIRIKRFQTVASMGSGKITANLSKDRLTT